MATGPHSQPLSMDSTLHILFLGTEWGSSQDDFSTLNRELAKHFAKCPKIRRVSFLVPHGKVGEAKGEALNYNVHLVEATYCPGMDIAQSLSFPPDSLGDVDVVIGCGLQLGPHAKRIKGNMKQCIWVQFVHESSEELGMFKGIPEYEEKHEHELELCRMADLVVALGPKLADCFTAPLRPDRAVIELVPGLCEQFAKLTPAQEGTKVHRILLFGDTDLKDFELKGFDVAAKAIGSMHQMKYNLIFVGAPEGKQDEVKKLLLQKGIATKQLTVRSFCESQERFSRMFLEADLCIMPSRTEGFGLTALKAISAGIPILVSQNSGFGQALLKVKFGSSCIVDSDDPKVWRRKMEDVLEKERSQRLKEAAGIRDAYREKYSWKEECDKIVERIWRVKMQDVRGNIPRVHGHSGPWGTPLHTQLSRSSSPQADGAYPPDPLFRKQVADEYVRRHTWFHPFPWLEHFQLSLEDVFTRLKIVVRERGRYVLSDDTVGMLDVFQSHKHCTHPRSVLVEADPGMGKTTFSEKLCLDWAMRNIKPPFPRILLVILLKCRDLATNDIMGAIADQLLPRDLSEIDKSVFLDYIREIESNVLLILDGMDELKEVDLSDLIQRKILSQIYLLVTTRQEAGIKIRQHFDSLFEITGYSVSDAKAYIIKYFKATGEKEKAGRLLDEIDKRFYEDGMAKSQEAAYLKELLSNPLRTSLLCAVAEDFGEELPGSRTLLYTEISSCILMRHFKKEQPDAELPEEPLEHYKEDLLTLGNLAYQGLEKDQLHFDARELKGQSSIAKFGFLSKEAAVSKRRPGLNYSFLHKTFQEYIAALYLCEKLVSGEITVANFIKQLSANIKKFTQTLLFSAGILAGKGETTLLANWVQSLARALTTLFVFSAEALKREYYQEYDDISKSFRLLCDVVSECSVGGQLTADQERMCAVIGQEISWKELVLDGEVGDETSDRWKLMCEIIKSNRTVKRLYLTRNEVTDVSLLVNSLQNNTVLELLYLSFNPIADFTALKQLKLRNGKLRIYTDKGFVFCD